MDKTINIYSFDEVLAMTDMHADFINQWTSNASNLKNVGSILEARYAEWDCLYCDSDLTATEIKAKAYNLYTQMTAWIKQYAPHWNELAGIEVKNSSKTIAKFNDTPETSGDYSSLEHTSTINLTENESISFSEQWERARIDYSSIAINEFRK